MRVQIFGGKDSAESLHTLFNLPEEEELVNHFSAALHTDMLQHGRLYITPNFVCFYSGFFGTSEIIPIRRIATLKKDKTAYVVRVGRRPLFCARERV